MRAIGSKGERAKTTATTERQDIWEADLVSRWIEPDADDASKAAYRVKGFGVQVWALTGYLRGARGPTAAHLDEAAQAFHLPREALEAALAFYRRHRALLDDRFDASAAEGVPVA